MPEPRPVQPRRDTGAADARTLERLGRIDPQPIPAPSIQPFQEPVYLEPPAPPDDET